MPTVIIVDDEPDLVSVLSDFLVANNITVIGTGDNGQEAVDLCVKHSPDYLILDLAMSGFDGFYTLEKLHEMKNPTKIIIISGLLNETTLNDLKKFNVFSVFTKPIVPNKLVECIINS